MTILHIKLTPFSHSKTHAEVTFIDYGNADKVPVTNLWYFRPEHVASAVQGIPVKVRGLSSVCVIVFPAFL